MRVVFVHETVRPKVDFAIDQARADGRVIDHIQLTEAEFDSMRTGINRDHEGKLLYRGVRILIDSSDVVVTRYRDGTKVEG